VTTEGHRAFDDRHPPESALIDKCVHCGFCLPSCPTYALWGEEMDSPRGRIYLMKSGLEGRVGLTPSFVEHFDACLGCMGCVTACPSGVQYAPLIEATRAQIERRHPRSLADRLFRAAIFAVVPFPGRLRLALAPVPLYRLIQPILQRTGMLNLLPSRLRALAALAPPVSFGGLASTMAERTAAIGSRRMTVGMLTGCVQRLVFSRVNEATARVLAAEGCDVVAPRAQGCCGALPLHSGRMDEAREFAKRAIATFDEAGVDRVVINAAGCGSAMKEYERLLEDDPDWAPRARAFSARVRDVSELLAELGPPRAPRHPLAVRVAYHDACHLAHAQGVRQQPRDLLTAIPDLQLTAFPEQDLCCGSAGIYNLVQPDAARDLGARKVRNILTVEPDVVATGNPGCTLQIAASAAQSGRTMSVLHPIELVDASMRGRPVDEVVAEGIYYRVGSPL
jgi:glycolate oxidase iron-sulfur subunit